MEAGPSGHAGAAEIPPVGDPTERAAHGAAQARRVGSDSQRRAKSSRTAAQGARGCPAGVGERFVGGGASRSPAAEKTHQRVRAADPEPESADTLAGTLAGTNRAERQGSKVTGETRPPPGQSVRR